MRRLLIFLLLILSQASQSQVSQDSDLFLKLKARDSLLFQEGFDKCHISKFEYFISEDLEFFHDQAGLSTSKDEFLEAIRQNICGDLQKKPLRKLKRNSLEVFPLFNNGELYGAIQKGEHDFYIQEPGQEMYKTSNAKFTHVWLLQEGEWMLKRVLSYDHNSPE